MARQHKPLKCKFHPGQKVCLIDFPKLHMYVDSVTHYVGYCTYSVWDGNDKHHNYDEWQIAAYPDNQPEDENP